MNCWKCGLEIGDFDNYCRYCGKGQGKNVSWYYKTWGLWFLFLCIGPFNLIFLWLSPDIGKKSKIAHTVVFSALTVWFAWRFYIGVKNIFDIYNTFLY